MKKSTMQRLIIAAIGIGASAGALADDGQACRLESLAGLYVFSATGYAIDATGVAHPKAIVELIRFNGDGTLSSPASTRSINGAIASSAGTPGTYTVEANCTGTLSFAGGPSFDIFPSPRGEDLWMIQTNPNNVFQGNVTRVSR